MELGDYFNEGTSPSVKTTKQPAVFQIADLYLKASIDAKITHLINRNKVYATQIDLLQQESAHCLYRLTHMTT